MPWWLWVLIGLALIPTLALFGFVAMWIVVGLIEIPRMAWHHFRHGEWPDHR